MLVPYIDTKLTTSKQLAIDSVLRFAAIDVAQYTQFTDVFDPEKFAELFRVLLEPHKRAYQMNARVHVSVVVHSIFLNQCLIHTQSNFLIVRPESNFLAQPTAAIQRVDNKWLIGERHPLAQAGCAHRVQVLRLAERHNVKTVFLEFARRVIEWLVL